MIVGRQEQVPGLKNLLLFFSTGMVGDSLGLFFGCDDDDDDDFPVELFSCSFGREELLLSLLLLFLALFALLMKETFGLLSVVLGLFSNSADKTLEAILQ
jgi:hypothetical protein